MPVSMATQRHRQAGVGDPCTVVALPYHADPAHYFRHVCGEPGAVLLDSGRPTAARGRYDIVSAWPVETLEPAAGESGASFLGRLRRSVQALGPARLEGQHDLPFVGGLIGYLAYDFGRRLEDRLSASPPSGDATGTADARFGVYDWALISDHTLHTTLVLFHPRCPESKRRRIVATLNRATPPSVGHPSPVGHLPPVRHLPPVEHPQPVGHIEPSAPERTARHFQLTSPFAPDMPRAAYRQAIARVHQYIQAGDCYQVNFAQRFQAGYRGDPWAAYVALRAACPTPFAGYVSLGGDDAILSLSPERFLRLNDRQIEARPIKGTRPRGATLQADEREARTLQESTKDRAENLMIVDLLRNDIGRVARIGTVRVPELFSLESYPNVHHLVSSVTAELAQGLDAFDLLAASFPGGSITGAPKLRAMQIIDELEHHARSVYCGSLLYIDVRGQMDSSIMIRSLLARDGRIHCWGGGGIVMDSHWESEYQESLDKVKVLMRTLEVL